MASTSDITVPKPAENSLLINVGKRGNVISQDEAKEFLQAVYNSTLEEVTDLYNRIVAEGEYILTEEKVKNAAEKHHIHYHNFKDIMAAVDVAELAKIVAEKQKYIVSNIIDTESRILLLEID